MSHTAFLLANGCQLHTAFCQDIQPQFVRYLLFQTCRDVMPAAYQNEKSSLTYLICLPL